MASNHDSDIATDPRGAMDEKERWSKAEWEHYELWEKIESRILRRKWLWITATVIVFVALSSVPIIVDRWPKWVALTAARKLGQEINRLKREAAIEHQAFRIRFVGESGAAYVIEKASACQDFAADGAPGGTQVREGSLLSPNRLTDYVVLRGQRAIEFGVPGLMSWFCYDALTGSQMQGPNAPAPTAALSEAAPVPASQTEQLAGFAILSAKDLTEGRSDRLSILLLKGNSAEISFD